MTELLSAQPASHPARPAPEGVGAYAALDVLQNGRSSVPRPGVFSGTLFALVTLGLGPAILWPLRFRRAAADHGQMLMVLSDFARPRIGPGDAARLDAAATRISGSSILLTLSLLGAVTAAASLLVGVTRPTLDPWHSLLATTFGAFWSRFQTPFLQGRLWLPYAGWTLGLTVAFFAYLTDVHLHARAIRTYLDEFNRAVVLEEGFSPVLLKPIGFGFSPLWVVAAVLLLFFSSGWSIAFAIAGATDRRLRRRAMPRLQEALADRLRRIVHARPERPRNAASAGGTTLCPTPGCGQLLQANAKFCPRCGTRRSGPVDRRV